MRRRNLLLGTVALGFGSSGIIASGAFGNDASDERGNWIETNEIDDSTDGEVRIETIADLGNTSHRFHQLERDDISFTQSSIIQEDESGFLQNIQFSAINDNSTTQVGSVDTQGNVDPAASAFVIANLGGIQSDSEGRAVELDLQLYDESRSSVSASDAVQFYYTIPDRDQDQNGELLTEDGVVVSPGEFLCVAIEINSGRWDNFGRIESIGLTIQEPNDGISE